MEQRKIKVMSGCNPAEIFQSLDIKFALLNEKDEQVHLGIKCRDFLGDCIWSKNNKARASIYSFTYNFEDKPYDTENPKMTLKFPDGKSQENFLKHVDFINGKEEIAGLEKKTVVFLTQEKDTVLVEFDKAWVEGAWKVSLYTFYLKLMSYDDPANPPVSNESSYLAAMPPEKEEILLANVRDYVTKWEGSGINKVHNYSGFKSVCTELNPIGIEFFGAIGKVVSDEDDEYFEDSYDSFDDDSDFYEEVA